MFERKNVFRILRFVKNVFFKKHFKEKSNFEFENLHGTLFATNISQKLNFLIESLQGINFSIKQTIIFIL